ncbi:MAG: malectin domain-containing carbohydrate-binding protein [Verrucomicrobiae bacterium]
MKTLVVCGLLCAVSVCSAVQLVKDDKPPINTLPVESTQWKSKVMVFPGKVGEENKTWSGPDFFMDEFGKPCVFDEDWLKEQGYASGDYQIENGQLVFNTGAKGFHFGFGPYPGDRSKPSPRFGRAWGANVKDKYAVEIEIEQDVPETEWSFTTSDFDSFAREMTGPTSSGQAALGFKIKGQGPQVVMCEVGLVRNLIGSGIAICGFKLTCTTPGANVKIKRLKVAPFSADVYFRKAIHIPAKPVIAQITYQSPETYDLYVNGKKVDSGTNIYPAGTVKTLDLLPYLEVGENVIAFRREFLSWAGGSPEWLTEGIVIDRDGNKTPILGDGSWKCAIQAPNDWYLNSFDDRSWSPPALHANGIFQLTTNTGGDGKLRLTGVDPAHMGCLQSIPAGREYPVFDFDAKDIAFNLSIPEGVAGRLQPILKVYETETRKLVETVSDIKSSAAGGGLARYVFPIKTRGPGAYILEWNLLDDKGQPVENREDELIIAGPLKQEQVALKDFEAEIEKRLRLVKKIDCAAEPPGDGEFIDHTGMYSTPAANQGKVVSADGMKYRETGRGVWSYFAYRLHLKNLGKPYLVEVIVPDNASRYVYSAIVESYPVGYASNPPDGRRGWHVATGTAVTGTLQPLSLKAKTLRYVCYPSSDRSAVMVMSGYRGFPAAACEINIYEIEGGLPALAISATDRLFGWHNERNSVTRLTTGMTEHPMMHDTRVNLNGHRLGWFHWYKTIERKIQLLRFNGMNMTSDGVVDGWGLYPSLRHSQGVSNQELDPFLLTLSMYKHNGIKCYLGMEYIASPAVAVTGVDQTSDRQMWQGKQGIYLVDRYGRQLVGGSKGGMNFLQPAAAEIMLDCIKEIHDRYDKLDAVEGMFLVAGAWWAPGFLVGSYCNDLSDTDVGYDDYTVGLFEKESGLDLKIAPKDTTRFQKRYDKLMSDYRPMWLRWRAVKIREFIDRIAAVIGTGTNKWDLSVYSSMEIEKNSPFAADSFRKDRDNFMAGKYRDSGFPLDLYEKNGKVSRVADFMLWGKYLSPTDSHLYAKGWNTNAGSREALKSFDKFFFEIHGGLDEVDNPADNADKWIWQDTSRGAFIPRGIGDNCMQEFVDIIAENIPRVIFYGWLDCNMDTAFGEQIRRFAASFYATPRLDFKALPPANVKGIIAQSASEKARSYLRLVNNSPYPVTGFLRADAASVRDLVYDADLPASMYAGKRQLSLKPNDIRIVVLDNLKGDITCDFAFPEKAGAETLAKAKFVMDNDSCLRNTPGDKIAALNKAIVRADAFAAYNVLNDFEMASQVKNAEREFKAMENQKAFLADLEKSGRAMIICASETAYVDPRGNIWHPDQTYTGHGAYGNEGASFADRGNIPIQDTDIARVYQTESYGGHVFYRIPVPNGKYNVRLHFAETYEPIRKAGVRLFTVKVKHILHPEKIDPFAMSGGWCKPYILEFKDLPVADGVIDIEMIGGVGIAGIEVEKATK